MTDVSDGYNPDEPSVSFDYIKAPDFRSLRADGAIGGVTPSNRIHMAIYSERPAIPKRTTFQVDEHGNLGKVVDVITRGSIVREMSADIFLDLRSAEAICTWLTEQIEQLKAGSSQNER